MNIDAVAVGSIISVVIAVVIVVFLVYKVIKLMNDDAKRHADEGQS
jgi:large-conductance mechanosensitive channel